MWTFALSISYRIRPTVLYIRISLYKTVIFSIISDLRRLHFYNCYWTPRSVQLLWPRRRPGVKSSLPHCAKFISIKLNQSIFQYGRNIKTGVTSRLINERDIICMSPKTFQLRPQGSQLLVNLRKEPEFIWGELQFPWAAVATYVKCKHLLLPHYKKKIRSW